MRDHVVGHAYILSARITWVLCSPRRYKVKKGKTKGGREKISMRQLAKGESSDEADGPLEDGEEGEGPLEGEPQSEPQSEPPSEPPTDPQSAPTEKPKWSTTMTRSGKIHFRKNGTLIASAFRRSGDIIVVKKVRWAPRDMRGEIQIIKQCRD